MENREQWRADEGVLAAIGATLFGQPTKVRVLLPATLAEAAVDAWSRNDFVELPVETIPKRVTRQRAGTPALIGLAIETDSQRQGESVEVELDSWYVGSALDAAEDANLLQRD